MNTQTNSTEANAVGNHPGGDRPAAPSPPPPASGSGRLAFEAWITAPPYEKDIIRWPENDFRFSWPGHYKDYAVQLAWEAWEEAQNASDEPRPLGAVGSGRLLGAEPRPSKNK